MYEDYKVGIRTEEITKHIINEEKLLSGKWDITLLTCTMDGRFRTVIRCEHKK